MYENDAERELYELIEYLIKNTKGEQAMCITKSKYERSLQSNV